MNRIKQIKIVLNTYDFNWVTFLDQLDIDNRLLGKTYTPSPEVYNHLRRIVLENKYRVDLDLNIGVINIYPPFIDNSDNW